MPGPLPLPQLGLSFLYPTTGGIPHLYVIASNPDVFEFVLAYNFTKYDPAKPGFDPSCVIEAGEYPDILSEKSFVYYRGGLTIRKSLWDRFMTMFAGVRSVVPPDLLVRIQKGALASQFVPRKDKEIIRASLIDP